MQTQSLVITIVIIVALVGAIWYSRTPQTPSISNFEACVEAGHPVMESYPRQCRTPDGTTFTEDIGNENDKIDLIRIDTPRPNATVTGPLSITGQARGGWFFEATFPIHLEDASGTVLATTFAQADGEWMTEEFVPFTSELTIPNTFSGTAILVLKKNNPSGLPEHADELRVPITVETSESTPAATLEIKAYFANSGMISGDQDECTTVFPVTRTVPRTVSVARTAMEQLLAGPTAEEQSQGYTTSINPGVNIQKLTIENGVARVDLSETLEQQVGGSCRVTAILAQIIETLQQFPTVRDVVISINDRTEDILQP
ncbi:MAG: GerMN domain-containing protein [Candidatus Andersenbacteria bacterium]